MKLFAIIFSIVSLGIIGFNLAQVNFNAPFQGYSVTALTVALIGLCALFLVWILFVSKQIQKKTHYKK